MTSTASSVPGPAARPVRGRADARYLPLAGAAYTALMVVAAAAFPMPPGGDVSPAASPEWLAAHVGAAVLQGYVRALAALAFVAFGASVAAACRRVLPAGSALPALALAGGVLAGGLLLLAQAANLAAALFVRDGGGAEATKALAALQDGLLDMSSVPALLLFAAAGLTALRTGLLPRWLALVSLAGVPFALMDAASYDGGPLEAVGLLGLFYFLAWSLVTGVRLHLVARQDVEPAPSREPVLLG